MKHKGTVRIIAALAAARAVEVTEADAAFRKAGAPDLLAALKHVVRDARKINRGMFKGQETVSLDGSDIYHVRAAIAKAEGRAE